MWIWLWDHIAASVISVAINWCGCWSFFFFFGSTQIFLLVYCDAACAEQTRWSAEVGYLVNVTRVSFFIFWNKQKIFGMQLVFMTRLKQADHFFFILYLQNATTVGSFIAEMLYEANFIRHIKQKYEYTRFWSTLRQHLRLATISEGLSRRVHSQLFKHQFYSKITGNFAPA